MKHLRRAWEWLKRWGAPILGLVATALGAGWLWQRHRAKLGRLKDKIAVAEAQRDIAALTARREALGEIAADKLGELQEINASLLENKRKIIEAHELGQGLDDDEVLAAFERLGY